MKKQKQLSETLFLRANEINIRFDHIHSALQSTQENLINFDQAEEKRTETLLSWFGELDNLISWYNLFHTGYHELLFEIQRRSQENQRQKELIQLINQELSTMHDEEKKKRTRFFEEFGKYLPSTLCPVIMEETAEHKLVCDFSPSPLPTLSTKYTRSSQNEIDQLIQQNLKHLE